VIDILTKIDELKTIKKMVEDGRPRYEIAEKCNDIIEADQKKVDEFEKWANEESLKGELHQIAGENIQLTPPEGGMVVSNDSDSPILAHPGSFPGEKSE